MAIVRVELFSESLLRKVPITCIIPIDKNNYFDLAKGIPIENFSN